eukprot:360531-Chlamydomonas_euryale.AAC.4
MHNAIKQTVPQLIDRGFLDPSVVCFTCLLFPALASCAWSCIRRPNHTGNLSTVLTGVGVIVSVHPQRKGMPVERAHIDAVMAAKPNAAVELLTLLYNFIHGGDFE